MNHLPIDRRFLVRSLCIGLLLIGALPLNAHVKWFSKYSFTDPPLQLADVGNLIFWVLLIISMITVGLLTLADKEIERTTWYQKGSVMLGKYKDKSVLIMRVATAAVLLVSWQLNTLVMPELHSNYEWMNWLQFFLVLLLTFKKTVPWAGAGLLFVYMIGVLQFGIFHMLDYFLIVGVGYFLWVSYSKPKLKATGLFLLYVSLGFSLCWAGMEKLIYPSWGVYLLEQYPQLSLGVGEKLFIKGAAFIEISVGIMFIFCFLHRILALVVTILFFLTSLVFGKTEIIGHLLIHATLIIFLIEGSGDTFKILPQFYRGLGRKPFFAALGFVLLLFVFLIPYTYGANKQFNLAMQRQLGDHPHNVEISDDEIAPKIALEVSEDQIGGWNISIIAQNFILASPDVASDYHEISGYGILLVDNKMVGRIYGTHSYLPLLDPGIYSIEVILHDHRHGQLTHLGMLIGASHKLVVD